MGSSKKVLFINYEFPPLGGGGGHANAQIVKRLADMGYDVSLMTSRFRHLPKEEVWEGVKIYRIPTLRRYEEKCSIFEMAIFLLMSLFYSIKLHKKIQPDVIVCFFSIPCGPSALLLNSLFQTPYVICLRGGDVPGFLPEQLSLYHKLTNWLTKWIWRRSRYLTANSEGLARLANDFYSHSHLTIIPNGVDSVFFNQNKIRNSKLRILTVGRLSEQKKIERLIESMARLKNHGEESIVLYVVGDGPLRKNLENLASEKGVLGSKVVFLGWCSREKIKYHYQSADVFALASDFEGMPNVILEAMASSCAIVATDAPGTVELVNHEKNGFLVARKKLQEFDRFFLLLKDQPQLLGQMQKLSYVSAQKYTWENVAQQYAELIDQSLEGSLET